MNYVFWLFVSPRASVRASGHFEGERVGTPFPLLKRCGTEERICERCCERSTIELAFLPRDTRSASAVS